MQPDPVTVPTHPTECERARRALTLGALLGAILVVLAGRRRAGR
jgi:hypothetical protein